MRSRFLYWSVIFGGLIIGGVLLGYPLLKSKAQKESAYPNASDVLSKRREDATASRFYDKARSLKPDLVLEGFQPSMPPELDKSKRTAVYLKNGSEKVLVQIFEHPSIGEAKISMNIHINGDKRPFPGHGDEGTKMYSSLGKTGVFVGIAVRKDKFYISVDTKDEKLAERLAGYALETISQ